MGKILGTIAVGIVLGFALMGVAGGFVYLHFPRPDLVGDDSILRTCIDMGGTPTWKRWPDGCEHNGVNRECYFATCVITSPTD